MTAPDPTTRTRLSFFGPILTIRRFTTTRRIMLVTAVAVSILAIGGWNVRRQVAGEAPIASINRPLPVPTSMVEPADGYRLARTYTGRVPVHVTDDMRAGVVSLPHGWGHASSAQWQTVAGEHAGVSANDWTDERLMEPIIGQSVLNGVPVTLAAAEKVAAA